MPVTLLSSERERFDVSEKIATRLNVTSTDDDVPMHVPTRALRSIVSYCSFEMPVDVRELAELMSAANMLGLKDLVDVAVVAMANRLRAADDETVKAILGPVAPHRTVRQNAGTFDVPHPAA